MIDPKTMELIHGAIDGTHTPAQSARLDAAIAGDGEVSRYYESLRRIASALRSADPVSPPPGAVDRALSRIPWGNYAGVGAAGAPGGIIEWFRWRPIPVLGLFATGAVVGALVLYFSGIGSDGNGFKRTLDTGDFSATMRSVTQNEGFAHVGTVGVRTDVVEGSFLLHRHQDDGLWLAEIDLHSEGPIDWVLDHEESHVSLEGFRRFAGGEGSVSADHSETRFQHSGDGRYILFFTGQAANPAPMTIRIYADNRLIFEDKLAANGAPRGR